MDTDMKEKQEFPLDWIAGGMVLPSPEMGGEMGSIHNQLQHLQ